MKFEAPEMDILQFSIEEFLTSSAAYSGIWGDDIINCPTRGEVDL